MGQRWRKRRKPGDAEAAETTASGAGMGVALAAAVGRRKGKAGGDLELDAFLAEHTRLARLQAEHLTETGEIALSRLRLGRFSDRMKALLQMMTALVGAGAVALVAAMIWQAHEQHGLEIEAFSVPPDLARGGLTGQVAASRFLDRLQALQTATEDSDRPVQSYVGNCQEADVKVEIPQDGPRPSARRFSRKRRCATRLYGHVTRVSGEVLTTPTGIAVTARMGDAHRHGSTPARPRPLRRPWRSRRREAVYRANAAPIAYAEYLDAEHGRSEGGLLPRSSRSWPPTAHPASAAGPTANGPSWTSTTTAMSPRPAAMPHAAWASAPAPTWPTASAW